MNDTVRARAQAEHTLEAAAQALKRSIGASRRALQAVRQCQASVAGIEVEHITKPLEAENGRENEVVYR